VKRGDVEVLIELRGYVRQKFFCVTNLRKEKGIMQSFELSQNLRPTETNDKSGDNPNHNMGLPLDLLMEGRNLRADEQFQPGSLCKAGCPSLPEMSVGDFKDSQTFDLMYFNPDKMSWGDDVYKWGKRFLTELKEAGYRFVRGLENIKPEHILDLAQDLAVVAAKFGPQIGADISRVIKAKGRDPVADAKLVMDLVDFVRSPEAGRVGEDVLKIIRDFQAKFWIGK
jgi:hypothetical protein